MYNIQQAKQEISKRMQMLSEMEHRLYEATGKGFILYDCNYRLAVRLNTLSQHINDEKLTRDLSLSLRVTARLNSKDYGAHLKKR